jgi:hypothetical protein
MSANTVVRLAYFVEPPLHVDCRTLDEARLAAMPLNSARQSLGLPLWTHAFVHIDGHRVAIRPLDPSAGA